MQTENLKNGNLPIGPWYKVEVVPVASLKSYAASVEIISAQQSDTVAATLAMFAQIRQGLKDQGVQVL